MATREAPPSQGTPASPRAFLRWQQAKRAASMRGVPVAGQRAGPGQFFFLRAFLRSTPSVRDTVLSQMAGPIPFSFEHATRACRFSFAALRALEAPPGCWPSGRTGGRFESFLCSALSMRGGGPQPNGGTFFFGHAKRACPPPLSFAALRALEAPPGCWPAGRTERVFNVVFLPQRSKHARSRSSTEWRDLLSFGHAERACLPPSPLQRSERWRRRPVAGQLAGPSGFLTVFFFRSAPSVRGAGPQPNGGTFFFWARQEGVPPPPLSFAVLRALEAPPGCWPAGRTEAGFYGFFLPQRSKRARSQSSAERRDRYRFF